MSELSASDYVAQQDALEREAKELMPWDPMKCTYSMGSLRQPVFACLSCNSIGICYSCSIQCHSSCDLVELFSKRHFTCDCGTERDTMNGCCKLRRNTSPDIPSFSNQYGQNFKGLFCHCHKCYDPDSNSVMLQCVLGVECNEDWYHDHCILGCEEPGDATNASSGDEERQLPGFPSLDSFDAYICWKCVSHYQNYFSRLISHTLSDQLISHKIPHLQSSTVEGNPEPIQATTGMKRKLQEEHSYSIFLSDGYSTILEQIKESLDANDKLYVFLNDMVPWLIHDDPVYEPPEDSDVETTSYELATRALTTSVNRDVAIDGLLAFQSMKSKLADFLKPFAESGKVVKKEDIEEFFQSHKH